MTVIGYDPAPVPKVRNAFIAGVVTFVAAVLLKKYGIDIDADQQTAIVAVIMSITGYLSPRAGS